MTDQRREYVVTLRGIPYTMLLSDSDAARYGDAAVEVKAAVKPANKARSPRNKSAK